MTSWDTFFRERVTKVLSEKTDVIDIGGGLRALPHRGNRYDPSRAWIAPLLAKVSYRIVDPVPDYQPDVVGDIHHLPFPDASLDAIFCLAVLEHVENPFTAFHEMHRVLRPGGYCFLYVPFLYYYHAETGYYKDYWRFTHDALALLTNQFMRKEIVSVRGALETWFHLSPFGKFALVRRVARFIDRITGKIHSKQVSGYYVFLIK